MVKYISEIASSHTGKIKLVEKISQQHCKSKSNYLKFQIFKAKNLLSKKNKQFSNYKKLEINFKNWNRLIKKYWKKTKIILEPFDEESYKFCKKYKKHVLLKVSSSESDNLNLIIDAMKNFEKVFINVSGLGFKNIKTIVNFLSNEKYRKKIIFMYGFQSYPTRVTDLRFNLFNYFSKEGFNFGYADHSKFGINRNVIEVCAYAKNLFKCSFIEKHVCYDLKSKPNDYISSINIKDINKFIQNIEQSKKKRKMSIKFQDNISRKEKKYFQSFSKFAHIKKSMIKGSILKSHDLIFLRSSIKKDGLTRLDTVGNTLKLKKLVRKGSQLSKSLVDII